jgi:hypothetical protein
MLKIVIFSETREHVAHVAHSFGNYVVEPMFNAFSHLAQNIHCFIAPPTQHLRVKRGWRRFLEHDNFDGTFVFWIESLLLVGFITSAINLAQKDHFRSHMSTLPSNSEM